MRNWFATMCAAVLLLTSAVAPAAHPERVVVMISVDGLASFYWDDPKAEMPTLRQLAKEGACADAMRAVAPSVTWPNHASLITGVTPGRHGVLGNNLFDRQTGKHVTLISDPVYDMDQIVRVPTIFDLAKSAGLTTASVRWPATRNAKTLDYAVPDMSIERSDPYTTPQLLADAKSAGIWFPKGQIIDTSSVAIFNMVLRKHRPDVGLLHIFESDHAQHLHGPRSPEAYAAIKEADRMVGQVWDTLKQEFPGRATLIVVADHGFSPIRRAILPNVILRDASLIDVKGVRKVGGKVEVVIQGGSAMVYILDRDNRDAIVSQITKAFVGVEGIASVAGPDELRTRYGQGDATQDPRVPDVMLFAAEGYSFGDTAAGALPFVEKPERKGTHGHNPYMPNLHATFVAWGAGIQPGSRAATIANTDVAPTMAKLLGLEMKNVDGRVLTEILAK